MPTEADLDRGEGRVTGSPRCVGAARGVEQDGRGESHALGGLRPARLHQQLYSLAKADFMPPRARQHDRQIVLLDEARDPPHEASIKGLCATPDERTEGRHDAVTI